MKYSLIPAGSLLQVLDWNDEHVLTKPMTKEEFSEQYLHEDNFPEDDDGDFFCDVLIVVDGVIKMVHK